MDKSIICHNCNEKLYRKCYLINGEIYCNRCIKLLFMKDVSDLEYLMEMNDDADDNGKDINETDA